VRDFDQLKSTLRNYYGVLIPKTIIKEVFALAPKGQIQNLGGFFKSKIFQSRTLTVEWIEKIKKAHVNTEH
jgi:rRNA-processing protein FCF1